MNDRRAAMDFESKWAERHAAQIGSDDPGPQWSFLLGLALAAGIAGWTLSLLIIGWIPLTDRNIVSWSIGVFFSSAALLGVSALLIYLVVRTRSRRAESGKDKPRMIRRLDLG